MGKGEEKELTGIARVRQVGCVLQVVWLARVKI